MTPTTPTRASVGTSVEAHRALASASRVRLLHVLQERDAPVSVEELADAVGLHVNTVREHLEHLVAARFVGRETEVRTRRGRPRVLYRVLPRQAGASTDARVREQLLRVLLDGYGRHAASAAGLAEASGRAWAERLGAPDGSAGAPAGGRAREHGAAGSPAPLPPAWSQLAALEQHFEELGFDPEADLDAEQVHLYRCPVRDLACERTEVVCSVHLGLARGVLAHVEGPLVADRLEPFVGAEHCVLHLSRRPDAGAVAAVAH